MLRPPFEPTEPLSGEVPYSYSAQLVGFRVVPGAIVASGLSIHANDMKQLKDSTSITPWGTRECKEM